MIKPGRFTTWQKVVQGTLPAQMKALFTFASLIASAIWLQSAPTFTGVDGDAPIAYSVSGNGEVVVGDANFGTSQAFRWTAAGGIVGLGTLGGTSSRAYDVSTDGSVITGFFTSGSTHAFRWTQSGGMVDIGTISGGAVSEGHGISADGNVIVGVSSISGGTLRAFRWTEGGGMQDLGFFPVNGESSQAYDVSADGAVVVGSASEEIAPFDEPNRAFRWTQAGGMVNLGLIDGFYSSQARGVSPDGSWITGFNEALSSDTTPFRWTQAGGMVALTEPLGATFSKAWDITNDGTTVGIVRIGLTDFAYLWDAAGQAIELESFLISHGIDLTGWDLTSAESITMLGGGVYAIAGFGLHDGMAESFLAVIPEPSTIVFVLLAGVFLMGKILRGRISALFRCAPVRAQS